MVTPVNGLCALGQYLICRYGIIDDSRSSQQSSDIMRALISRDPILRGHVTPDELRSLFNRYGLGLASHNPLMILLLRRIGFSEQTSVSIAAHFLDNDGDLVPVSSNGALSDDLSSLSAVLTRSSLTKIPIPSSLSPPLKSEMRIFVRQLEMLDSVVTLGVSNVSSIVKSDMFQISGNVIA